MLCIALIKSLNATLIKELSYEHREKCNYKGDKMWTFKRVKQISIFKYKVHFPLNLSLIKAEGYFPTKML